MNAFRRNQITRRLQVEERSKNGRFRIGLRDLCKNALRAAALIKIIVNECGGYRLLSRGNT